MFFFNFNNLFLLRGVHKLTHTNKTIYQQIYFQFIIKVFLLFCFAQDRLKVMKSQRFVLRRCLKNLTMGNPIKHSEHLFYAG